jgi:UDP-glucose/galactose:(glucosyl)LPS alpha-1,2-glucosyl/galactosyltransferase
VDTFPCVTITDYLSFDERQVKCQEEECLNVAYGVDKNYLVGVGVSITSLLINNKSINFSFHIIADEYDENYPDKIKKLAVKYNAKISMYKIESEKLKVLPSTKIWSHAMYFRLFAFDAFSNRFDRLLYLDADVICKGSLKELVSLNLNNYAAAVVPDVESMQDKAVERLHDKKYQGYYFNSGVVLANLSVWKQDRLTQKALDILCNTSYKYPDQDVLNVLLSGKLYYLPRKFNTIYTIKSELKDRTHQDYSSLINDETILIHYTGVTKPWHQWACYPSVRFYDYALRESPWKDLPRKSATSMMEFKKQYKHMLIQGRYLKGIICGIEYGYRKYLRR